MFAETCPLVASGSEPFCGIRVLAQLQRMSVRAASSRGGRASSSRAGSKSDPAAPQQHSLQFFAKIDVQGKDSFPKGYTLEVKARVITLRPEGKRCKLCPLADNMWCPLAIASGERRYVRWGKPPNPEGLTQGCHCGFCVKFWAANVKNSRVPPISISEYEAYLGQDSERLQKTRPECGWAYLNNDRESPYDVKSR